MYKNKLKDCVTGEVLTTQVQKVETIELNVKEVALASLEIVSKQPNADYKPMVHQKVSKGLKVNDLSKEYLCSVVSAIQPAGVAEAFKVAVMGEKKKVSKKSSSR